MPINPSKGGGGALRIENLDSFLDGSRALPIDSIPSRFTGCNFYRENSNHSYLRGGKIEYAGNCENNLVISSRKTNYLGSVKNSFVFSCPQYTRVFPISDIETAKGVGDAALCENICYSLPSTVKQRERLLNHGVEKIASLLRRYYGIAPKAIHPLSAGRTKGGKYFIADSDGREYVFKYRGENETEVEASSRVLNRLECYLPRTARRKDSSLYCVKLKDGFYGLEDFVRGEPLKRRNLDSLGKIGRAMAGLHCHLDGMVMSNAWLPLPYRGGDFNESNVLSMYFDIGKDLNSKPLVPFIEEVIDSGLSSRVRNIPRRVIHGDINGSNTLRLKGRLMFIDSETFGIDCRLKEFLSPLLLDGNMGYPNYIKGGMQAICSQYNQNSNHPLSPEELSVLPHLLQASILKHYVVREIRRGMRTADGLKKTIGNLEKIKEDSNAH